MLKKTIIIREENKHQSSSNNQLIQ